MRMLNTLFLIILNFHMALYKQISYYMSGEKVKSTLI